MKCVMCFFAGRKKMGVGSCHVLFVASLLLGVGCVHALNPFTRASSAFDGEFSELDLVSWVEDWEPCESAWLPIGAAV